MRKVLTITLFLLLMLNNTLGDMDPRYSALNFGNHPTNYILFKPDMEPLRNEFTICSWLKSFLGSENNFHVWVSYALNESSSGHYNEIAIGDAGVSFIFDTELSPSLRPSFTELQGNKTWFHYCTSWSFSTRIEKFYLNGNKIGETTTPEDRKLGVGGYLAIGGDQDSYGGGFHWDNRFGGELYKLNFFSKELSASEIMEISRYMCWRIEETYGEVRHIKWEDIVMQKEDRNGNVTDLEVCKKDPNRLLDILQKELIDTNNKLNDSTGVQDQIKKEQTALRADLLEKTQRLNITIQEIEKIVEDATSELGETKKNLKRLLNESRKF